MLSIHDQTGLESETLSPTNKETKPTIMHVCVDTHTHTQTHRDQAVVAHAFNPRTREAEVGESL